MWTSTRKFSALCKTTRKIVGHLNFPIGKKDHNDNEDVKQTTFREQLEATGVKLTEDEIKNASGPFEVALPIKNVKLNKL